MPSLTMSLLMVAYTFVLVRFTPREVSQRSIRLAMAALAFLTIAAPILALTAAPEPGAMLVVLATGKALTLALAGYASRRTSPEVPEQGWLRRALLVVVGIAVAVSVPFAISGGYAALMLVVTGTVILAAVVGYFIAPKKGYQPEDYRLHERRRVMAGMLLYQCAAAVPMFITFGRFA